MAFVNRSLQPNRSTLDYTHDRATGHARRFICKKKLINSRDRMMQTMPLPTNQGDQNTCAHWAVAQAISQGIAMRYGKCLDVDQVALVIEQHVPAWREGISVNELCTKWNEACHDKWLTTAGDRLERFNVRLESPSVIEDMAEAHRQLERVHGIRLLVCAVQWGRGSHAVVADMPYLDERGQPSLRAVNSHGYQSRPFIDINDNIGNMHGRFQFAVIFKPTIVGWAVGPRAPGGVPNELPSYKAKEAGVAAEEKDMEEDAEEEHEEVMEPGAEADDAGYSAEEAVEEVADGSLTLVVAQQLLAAGVEGRYKGDHIHFKGVRHRSGRVSKPWSYALPSNPTGTIVAASEREAVLGRLRGMGVLTAQQEALLAD